MRLLRNGQNLPIELSVLDLCTGTGCIPLLFQHEFYSARRDIRLHILGVDISKRSIRLANENLKQTCKNGQLAERADMRFLKADIMVDGLAKETGGPLPLKAALRNNHQPQSWDILISNPPYISPSAYWKTTTRSVRGFEPKLALVPPWSVGNNDTQQGDRFYPRLLDIAKEIHAKVVLFEVANIDQALRVARAARDRSYFDAIEVWREQPDAITDCTTDEDNFPILGQGNARSVVCWSGAGASWLNKTSKANSSFKNA